MSKKEATKKETKVAELKKTMTAAGITPPADSKKVETYFKNQMDGASLVLQSAGMNPAVLGFSDLQVLATAKTLLEVKEKESLAKKRETAKETRKSLVTGFQISIKPDLNSISGLIDSLIGVNPAKSLSSETIELDDGSKIAVSLTAIKKNPDSAKNQELKETAKGITKKLSEVVTSHTGLKKVSDLLKLEAGTKDNKAISLFPTDPKKPGCISDNKYIYQISLKYAANETD